MWERRVVCSKCGTDNEAGLKYCDECGSALTSGCPSCGAANRPTAKFCGVCGTHLAEIDTDIRPSPVRASVPVAERRLVSVLFADLVDFTTLSEGRDAEDTRALLSRYFDLSRDVIGRYGGTIEKFIGDAVMAVWGAPTAHEDDAERAVRAGLELVDAVKTLGTSIQARAGVLTGEAAVTIGATNQGMVAGDLVNTASRLQSAASPGTVLVGEATERAASRAIVFEPAGEQVLKGKASPVPAWRALRVVAERGGRGRSETLEAPFVGRGDELRLLKDLFHATGRERRARLVSVIGPGGIGKTRLAWEFTKYLDGLIEPVWWHDGRSPAYGDGISFWALGEMVRRRCGLRETDDEATTRERVAATLAGHVPDPEERRWIEPALLALLGVGGSATGSDQLFGAWRTFFERLAATAPVVMIFEDHHYADDGLLDFVDHLLEWSRGHPIYVVTLGRPELLDRRTDWGVGKRNFTSLYLEPLPVPAMRELLAGLVPGLPEAAVRSIVARADGIPLYAVETVRMLLAEGKLTLQGDVYAATGVLAELAVPETLTALIGSRLDALPAGDRGVVADAAVLGQSFTLAGLAAVSGLEVIELEPRLRALVRRELLTLEVDPRSPERGQYAFVQALIREVAYNTLARSARKERHLAAARFFEGLGSDELAGALAGHYLAAFRSSTEGTERDALAAQARFALRAAADRASSLGSHEQALAFLAPALELATDPAEEAALRQRAGTAAAAISRVDDALAHLRRALEIHEAAGDRDEAATTLFLLAQTTLTAFRVEDALVLLEPAVRDFADLADTPVGAAIAGQLARAYQLGSNVVAGLEWSDRVLGAAERADATEVFLDALVTRANVLSEVGRLRESWLLYLAAYEQAETAGLAITSGRALISMSATAVIVDPREALDAGRRGMAHGRRRGNRLVVRFALGNAAEAALRTGDWAWAADEVAALLEDVTDPADREDLLAEQLSIQAYRGAVDPVALAEFEHLVAGMDAAQTPAQGALVAVRIAFAEGRLEDAYRAGLRNIGSLTMFDVLANALAARAALWSGDVARARVAIDRFEGRHTPLLEAERATVAAGVAAIEGSPDEATRLYEAALARWRELGLAFDEALCGLDMATLLDPAAPEVRTAADSAREILVGLEAVPFVARLDAALARGSSPAGRSPAFPSTVSGDASMKTR
jgi:class 3 adenylate cyclase/tetratricopeptide (TPR) repeat protein